MNSFKISQKEVFKQKSGEKGVGETVLSRAALAVIGQLSLHGALKE